MQAHESGVDRKISFLVMGKKGNRSTVSHNVWKLLCFVLVGLHFLQKSWFVLSIFAQRAKTFVIFWPFDSPFKTFVCNPAFCQDKVYSAFSGSGAKFSTSAFFMFPKPFVQIFCPADVVLGWMSWTYRLFKVQKIHVSCNFVCHFWMWWKMFAAAGETNLSLRHNWITSRFLARSFCCCRCCYHCCYHCYYHCWCRCCYGYCFREGIGSLRPAALAR